MFRSLYILVLLFGSFPLLAQNVGGFFDQINQRIQDKDIIRLNGALNANLSWNTISGISRRQDNFMWSAGASISLDLMGIKTPFSAAFSNGSEVYRLPSYSFYGLSPSYKWITLHGGDRNMTLSPYTFSGTSFRGGGVELTPGKITFGAFHGRLRRASAADAGAIQAIESRFRRMGSGLKFGFSGKATKFTVAGFYGRDVEEVLSQNSIDTLDSPEENLAISIELDQKISSALSFRAILARTALTRDHTANRLDNPGFGQRMYGLYRPFISTSFHNAYEFVVNFQPKVATFGLHYKRVDPGYRTLGSLFFQNDLENITGQFSMPIAEGKFQLMLSSGLQRNNLASQNASDFSRFIGSANLSATWSERLSTQLSASNFNTTNRLRAIAAVNPDIDSIVIVQSNVSLSLGGSYLLGKDKNHVFAANFSYQAANAIRNEEVDTTQQTNFMLGVINYSYRPKKGKGSLTVSVLANRNTLSVGTITTLGPSLSFNRPILNETVSLNSTAVYSRVMSSINPTSSILRLQLSSGIQVAKTQNLSFQCSYVINNAAQNSFREFQVGLSYGMTFAAKRKQGEKPRQE